MQNHASYMSAAVSVGANPAMGLGHVINFRLSKFDSSRASFLICYQCLNFIQKFVYISRLVSLCHKNSFYTL
jgi:hypothetical protein